MKHMRKICVLASAALVGCVLLAGCGEQKEQTPTTKVDVPVVSGKQPSQYTWAEYLAMDGAQKEAFRQSFGSDAVFEAWMEKAQRQEPTEESKGLPWEQGGKQPEEYTWAEFAALTGEEQMAFQNALGAEAFEAWLDQAQNPVEPDPWDQPGAKQPEAYTWEEFEALSAAHQMRFQNALGEERFEQWLIRAQRPAMPWDNGGKQPEAYSWAEFEALTGEQQMAFQDSFASQSAFDAWLEAHLPRETTPAMPWDNGGKQPADYTWADFEALTGEQQMAFQDSFDSQSAFDAWLEQNLPRETTPAMPWDNGGKQPADYTWAEFEALTGEQQMAFQNAMGAEAFEAWLNRAQNPPAANPWDHPGAKQPKDYTWAEFEALTGEQQMAFQSSFANFEDFEAWLQRVNP